MDNGLPKAVFDDLQAQLAANRSNFYRALPEGPFYGYNRPGAKPSEAIIANWWRQGMMGGAKAHYEVALRYVDEANLSDALKRLVRISIPVAAILVPAGFFFSVVSPDATAPNNLINLVYVGAAVLAIGVLILGVGLIRRPIRVG